MGYHSAMRMNVQKFAVSFEYPVVFTENVFSLNNTRFLDALCRLEPERQQKFFVVIDSGVTDNWPNLEQSIAKYADHHQGKLELLAPPMILPGGEECKSDPAVLRDLLNRLFKLRLDRQSSLVIIGGGAVLDTAGYAAAIVHRGLRTVRMPTTVLSQDDSGVGVKNGINAFNTKNYLGTFWPPYAVINDFRFIDTLEARDKIAGMAEAVKVALIRDAQFFDWIKEHIDQLTGFEPAVLDEMIYKAALLHQQHISLGGDPFEMGNARPLDFGHWAAHKLESMTDYQIRHGEGVAIGMALDSRYSVESGLAPKGIDDQVYQLLTDLGLPLWHDALLEEDKSGQPLVLDGLKEFQEHLGGELTVTLLEEIGKGVEVHQIDPEIVIRCIHWLRDKGAK